MSTTRTNPFQWILSFLALVGTTCGSIAPAAECATRAWVRAPDLTPSAIVHGDARVKISAECPTVENVSLGLRFKERSIVKALRSREDLQRLNPELSRFDFRGFSPWASMSSRFANKSVEEAYEETLTNKDLWIVREEERLAFETTQPINMGSGDHGALRDTVQEFSILVPSTNFPPVPDTMGSRTFPHGEILDVEWMYEYFAQISFVNGTTKEISAGFTTFQPQYDPAHASQGLTTATVGLTTLSFGPRGEKVEKKSPAVNYSIEISADSGLTFFAGTKNHVVTAIVTRTGLARTFSAPMSVLPRVIPGVSQKWAAEYHMSDDNAELFPPRSVRRAKPGGDASEYGMRQSRRSRGVSVLMPNSTSDEIQANEIVTTTSTAFTMSIGVDDTHVTDFEAYYQTLANVLFITLETNRGENEDVDPDDPSSEREYGFGPSCEDDEYAWVPWGKARTGAKMWRSYSGRVPVVVYPAKEETPSQHCLHASTATSGQVVLSDETVCEQRSLSHYLDDGARGPTFVDRSTIHEVLAESPAKRELRAPILEPVVSSPPNGEELVYRYYNHAGGRNIYVGETWVKKVVNENKVTSATSDSGPIVHE